MTSKRNFGVIGATDRPEQPDNTLYQHGRLDTLIYVPLPDEASHVGVLQSLLRKTSVVDDVDPKYIAGKTHGFSGADLGFITQRPVKLAINDFIAVDVESENERARAGEDVKVEEEIEAEDHGGGGGFGSEERCGHPL